MYNLTSHTFYTKPNSIQKMLSPKEENSIKDKSSMRYKLLNPIKSKSYQDYPKIDVEYLKDQNIKLKIDIHKNQQMLNLLKVEMNKIDDDNKKVLNLMEDILNRSHVNYNDIIKYIEAIKSKDFTTEFEFNLNLEQESKVKETYLISHLKNYIFELKKSNMDMKDELSFLKCGQKISNYIKMEKDYNKKLFEIKELTNCYVKLKSRCEDKDIEISSLKEMLLQKDNINAKHPKTNQSCDFSNIKNKENLNSDYLLKNDQLNIEKNKNSKLNLGFNKLKKEFEDFKKLTQEEKTKLININASQEQEIEKYKKNWKNSLDKYNIIKISHDSLNFNCDKLLALKKQFLIENEELKKTIESLEGKITSLEKSSPKKVTIKLHNDKNRSTEEEDCNDSIKVANKALNIEENEELLNQPSGFKKHGFNKLDSKNFENNEEEAENNESPTHSNNSPSILKKKNENSNKVLKIQDPQENKESYENKNNEDQIKPKKAARKQFTVITEEGDVWVNNNINEMNEDQLLEKEVDEHNNDKPKKKITEIKNKWNSSNPMITKHSSEVNKKARYSLKIDKTSDQNIDPLDNFYVIDKSFDINSFLSDKKAKSMHTSFNKLPTLDNALTQKILGGENFEEMLEDPIIQRLMGKINLELNK